MILDAQGNLLFEGFAEGHESVRHDLYSLAELLHRLETLAEQRAIGAEALCSNTM